jgi:hypothetical protein
MAVQTQVWLPAIQENLYKGMELIRTVAADDSSFVNNNKVNVPNAGAAATVSRNNTTYPVSIVSRTDTALDYTLRNFEMAPTRMGWADDLQLSYDKVKSLMSDYVGNMNERIKDYILSQWFDAVNGEMVSTTGSSTTTNWLGGTAGGSLKHLIGADVRSAAKILDYQKMPSTDRYLLLDPDQFWQLLGDMSYNAERIEVVAGLSATINPIYGFKVIQLPYVSAVTVNTGTAAMIEPDEADGSYTFTTNNRPIGLAFHKSAVSHALTDVKMFTQSEDPVMYGDVMSASLFGGGLYRRTNSEGVVAIRSTSA